MTYQEIVRAISQWLGCANESLPVEERHSLLQLISQQQDARADAEILAATPDQAAELGDEDVIHAIDRNGNRHDYQIKDLIWNPHSYDYIKNQSHSFKLALPELIHKYAGKYIVFEDGKVIDSDEDRDILLDRICETDFYYQREAIYCDLVPEKLKINA
jgi:Family of unknown function (DUF5678)